MGATVGEANRTVERSVGDVPASTAVIEAIAELESTSPTALDVTLYDAIDLDALDALCGDTGVVVSFTTDEYGIEIRTDRTVLVHRR